jgi:hypothetical protein
MPFAALTVSLASPEYPSAMTGHPFLLAEVQFEGALGLQALREQGGRAGLGRVGAGQRPVD